MTVWMHPTDTCDTYIATMPSNEPNFTIRNFWHNNWFFIPILLFNIWHLLEFQSQRSIFRLLGCVEVAASVRSQSSTSCHRSRSVCPVVPNDRWSSLNGLTMRCFLFRLFSPASISVWNRCSQSMWPPLCPAAIKLLKFYEIEVTLSCR